MLSKMTILPSNHEETEREKYTEMWTDLSVEVYPSDPGRYEDIDDWTRHITDAIGVFNMMLALLMGIVNRTWNWQVEDEDFQVFLKSLRTAVRRVAEDFQPNPDTYLIEVSEEVVLSSLVKLKLIKKDMKQVYSIISEVSRSGVIPSESTAVIIPFINMLLNIIEDILSSRLGLEERKRKKKSVVVQKLRRKKEVDLIAALRKKIEALEEELRFLRYFLWVISIKLEKTEHFQCQPEALVVRAACLICLCLMHGDRVDEKLVAEMKKEMLDLVAEFKALQHEIHHNYFSIRRSPHSIYTPCSLPGQDRFFLTIVDSLMDYLVQDLSRKNAGLIVFDKDQIEVLIEDLRILRYYFLHNIEHIAWHSADRPTVAPETDIVFMEMGYLIYLSRDEKRNEEITQKVLARFSGAIGLIEKDISSRADKFITVSRHSNFPHLTEAGFVLNNLIVLMQYNADSVEYLKQPFETICEQLLSVRELLTKDAEFCKQNTSMKALLSRFKDVAYYTELLISSAVMDDGRNEGYFFCLLNAQLKIKIILQEAKAILDMTRGHNLNKINVLQASSSQASSQAGSPQNMDTQVASKDEVESKEEQATHRLVGLENATEAIRKQLTRGSKQLQIVSIVGMPGVGKTTLANSIYKSPSVRSSFNVHAWFCISQFYDLETLLSDIFYQIGGETNQHHEANEDIAEKVKKRLLRQKYLIVIDDIWDCTAWNKVRSCFPNDNNGSRILFTTRHRAVALEAESILYNHDLLSKDENLKLLHLELFGQETCPSEFRTITKQIAESCDGLPLSVVLIAGVLKKTERKRESWKQVAETLSWSSEVQDILELSYVDLPDSLKPCFLYFAAFPEDATISVSKLIRLWISEGFIQQSDVGQKSLEQEAENYLNILIDRSLVMIAERSSRGGVKSCRVHDLLREFCLFKSDEECFLVHEKRYQQEKSDRLFSNSDQLERYRLYISSSSVEETAPLERVGILYDFFFRSRVPQIRSLFYHFKSNKGLYSKARDEFSEADDMFYGSPLVDGTRLIYLPLLRVLDLTNVHNKNRANIAELQAIAHLVHLRYLALQIRTNKIPPEFGNLRNLETFLLSGVIGRVMLPEELWNLSRLRHVHATNEILLSFRHYSDEFFQNSTQLESLKTFSIPSLCYGDNGERILRRLPNLQKLGCRFLNSWDDSTNCNNFPVLTFLTQLESLKVLCSGKARYPCTFHFPSCLKKLTMSKFRLPWDEISVIGEMLPNLEVLKLLNSAFEGKEWITEGGAFENLKFLKLDSLDIEEWDASDESFPKLEQLVVVRCQHLQKIPSAIGEIGTLKLIEMKWCSCSATDSVNQILDDQRDEGNYELQVNLVGPSL